MSKAEFTLPNKMFVYPVQRSSAQGRGSYSFLKTDGTSIPANRTFSRTAVKYYQFPASSDNMSLYTGMDKRMPNPFLAPANQDRIGSAHRERKEEIIAEDTISIQEYLEIVDNVPLGTYTGAKQVRAPFSTDPDIKPTFLERFKFGLQDNTNILDGSTQEGRIGMLLMYANPKIASSRGEVNPAVHDFYIGQEFEAMMEKKNKRQIIGEAIAALAEIRKKYDDFILYQLAVVLKLARGRLAPQAVNDHLDDYLWAQTKDQLQRAEKFKGMAEDLKNKNGLQRLYVRYLVAQAILNNLIYARGGKFYWASKRGIENLHDLGTKVDSIVQMFLGELTKYDPSSEADNWYGDLIAELKEKDVRLVEHKVHPDRAKNKKK